MGTLLVVEERYAGNMKQVSSLAWAALLAVALISMVKVQKTSAELSAAECHEERRIGVNACKPVIYGRLPSPECCERVRVSHIECVCPVVTPRLAALIDLNRAIRLIEGCGRRVPRHYKCGSITTP